ncbi:MAG: AAA family ATPase [Rickettsiales bacterium]|nr:AAA family ATPase [Rickettsiales bacterium]
MAQALKSHGKAEHDLDDLLGSDNGQKHYESLAYGYIKRFIENTDVSRGTAYKVCGLVEEDEIALPKLSKIFPPDKKEYTENRDKLESKKKKLETEIKALEKKISATDSVDKADEEKLSELQARLKELVIPPKRDTYYDSEADKPVDVRTEDWEFLKDWFGKQEKRLANEKPSPLLTNMEHLSNELELDPDARKFLTLVTALRSDFLRSFIDGVCGNPTTQAHFNAVVARMLDMDIAKVTKLLSEDSPLISYGIISKNAEETFPWISGHISGLLSEPNLDVSTLRSKLAGETITTNLDWQKDFDGLGEHGKRIEKLIRHAQEERRAGKKTPGPVIFFSGITDTGKTSAVAALGKHLGMTVKVVGERAEKNLKTVREEFDSDDDGEGQIVSREVTQDGKNKKLSALDRFSQVQTAARLSEKDPNTLLLVEEPDRFMPTTDGENDEVDRVLVQRLFENNPSAGLVFTTNNWEQIHPAVKRRAHVQVDFAVPNAHKRAQIVRNICAEQHLDISDKDIEKLAITYRVAAGKWASAIKNAAITAEGPDQIISEIKYWIEAQAVRDHGSVSAITSMHTRPEHGYDFKLVNPVAKDGVSLEQFTEFTRSQPPEKQKFRILLDGPPGTGKSEYIWHLADLIGRDVIYAKASDILDMYVGGSEKNIAEYFRRAEESGSILFIDEVDSILRERSGAERGYEVSQVNQFLTNLEHYKGMIACSTNNPKSLDAAVFRRFKFRTTFDFLTTEQCEYAYKTFFGREAPPNSFDGIRRLVPADFVNAKEQASDYNFLEDDDRILKRLKNIEKDKPKWLQPHGETREMGFTAGMERRGDWKAEQPKRAALG